MLQVSEIMTLAHRQPLMQDQLQLLHQLKLNTSGGIGVSIYRYELLPGMQPEDVGMLSYHYHPRKTAERKIELLFCISGNSYCNAPECKSGSCVKEKTCSQTSTFDILLFTYPAIYLKQFVQGTATSGRSDELLAFKKKTSFSHSVTLCNRTRSVLDQLLLQPYTGAMAQIYMGSQLQSLLLFGLECLVEEKAEESFSCKFLSNDTDREKMILAREILLQRIGEPITIKELSRKVGTNECYLKKGFKELFGTTIFEYYQNQRMDHARYLLYEKGLSVTEVSALLGYSSISHFSTAFKRHTGIKPCELLLR